MSIENGNEYQIGLDITIKISDRCSRLMTYMRDTAVKLIRCYGKGITADDLRNALGIPKRERGANNFMGSVFRHDPLKRFVQTGERRKSKTEGSHGNDLPVWTLKDGSVG